MLLESIVGITNVSFQKQMSLNRYFTVKFSLSVTWCGNQWTTASTTGSDFENVI